MNSLAGSLKLRLSTGLAAQTYSQVVTIGAQLISVPVLISAWGVEQYGVWLLISAIPAYLALADLGFAQVGGSDMTMRLARGDREGAITSYQTTFAMNCVLGLACFAAVAAFALSPLSRGLIGEAHATSEVQWAIVALAGHAMMSLMRGVIGAALRSQGKFSLLVALSATMRLNDAVILLTVAVLGGSILEAAGAMVAAATATIIATILWFERRHPSLRLGFGHASVAAAKDLLSPSLHFLSYVTGNLLSIQGATIIIGAMLGPTAVALASTTRTLVRTGITAANMLSNTLQIEYSATFGGSALGSFKRLFRWHVLAIVALIALYLGLMLPFGPAVYAIWTHGALGMPHLLLGLLAAATAGDMLWTGVQTPSISVNRMRLTGRTFLLASALGLIALGTLLPRFGIIAFGWISIAISATMVMAAAIEARRLSHAMNTIESPSAG